MSGTLALAPVRSADAEVLARWITDPKLLLEWAGPVGFGFPVDPGELRAHWSRSAREQPRRHCLRAEDPDGALIGYGELSAIDPVHGSARLSRLLIGDAASRGRGLGGALVEALLQRAFEGERLHRVELGVFAHNEAAIRCYARAGFVHEGTRRECQRFGQEWWSSHVMAVLEPEWRARTSRPEP